MKHFINSGDEGAQVARRIRVSTEKLATTYNVPELIIKEHLIMGICPVYDLAMGPAIAGDGVLWLRYV